MNERLTTQDLIDLLAAKHSMTKKDAEAFVKEFFLLIEQALESEKTLKIKGLGTFKLIDVDDRESIKINTGERFQIKGYAKVSFSPDANLRDTINKPFAHFETVVLNENAILEDTPVEEDEEVETEREETVEQQPEEPAVKEKEKETPIKEKSLVPYLIAVIILVLLLCGGVILFIYYPDLFFSSSDKNTLEMPPVTTQPVRPEAQMSDTIEYKDTIKEVMPDIPETENKVVQQQSSISVYSDSASYKITGTKTKYTIKEGETLTRVSLRFYGTKAMWPYIVKHNPGIIKNPDNVPYGTTIQIPELSKE